MMQALFLPVLAISFAASPVAGQNFGARLGDRVRQTFFSAAALGAGIMFVLTLLCHLSPESFIRLFSTDPPVIAFGADYLRIISWNFVAMGLIFTSSAMFPAMGNSWPPLAVSCSRLVLFALPASLLSVRPGFTIRQVWYLSVATVTL